MGEVARLLDAALALTENAAAARWRGPDPYDGLWWQWPRVLVDGPRRRQAITQLHVRAPVDLRRLYRRSHPLVPKALAIFGSAGLRIHALTGNERARELALDALDLLNTDHVSGPDSWGYHFDVQTRWSFNPAGSPNVVNTGFAVGALLEAERDADRTEFGNRARAAARWVMDSLWVETGGYFAYHRHSRANIHNANLLGAWLVWAALGNDDEARGRVLRAVDRTVADQRADGSWPYGEGEGDLGWADSFHSGYTLLCLDRLQSLDPGIGDAVKRGAGFYRSFFGLKGEAQLWAHRRYPEDGHSAGTGLSTLAVLFRRGLAEQELLERVAVRLVEAGIRDGHAVFRRYRGGFRTIVKYVRWCDAHVALGLADAALAIAGFDDFSPTADALSPRAPRPD